jgi:hypothetical protein
MTPVSALLIRLASHGCLVHTGRNRRCHTGNYFVASQRMRTDRRSTADDAVSVQPEYTSNGTEAPLDRFVHLLSEKERRTTLQ